MDWKNQSYIKRGFVTGLIIGISILLYLIMNIIFYTFANIGEYTCPGLLHVAACTYENIPIIISSTLFYFGLPIFILSLIVGCFFGWSLTKKYVLVWEFIGIGVILLMAISSLISSQVNEALYGRRGLNFNEFLINLAVAIIIGAIIGRIVGKIKGK